MPFDQLIAAGLRGLHLAALALCAGLMLIGWLQARPQPRLRLALLAAMGSGALWLAVLAQAATDQPFPHAQWLMLTGTGFGRMMALRLGLLALALALPRGRLALVIAATLLQPLLGHGAALPWMSRAAGALHVLAGLLWVGALPALYLLLRRDPRAGLRAARRFSPLGVGLVLMLSLGILGQWALVGGLHGLIGTTYGQLLLLKSLGLALMLACAALNGLRFAPRGQSRALRRSLTIEGGAGLLVLLLAGLLATQPPGAHATVVWPLPWRPVAWLLDEPVLREGFLAMALPAALAGALILSGLALLAWSRRAGLILMLAAAGVIWATPRLPPDQFLAPAYPTSYQHWDQRRTAASLAAGRAIYRRDCAGCHGDRATGGPGGPDLSSSSLVLAFDGDWFWQIRHGIDRNGLRAMPAQPQLSDTEIWQVIDHLRANASAHNADAEGRWLMPPAAPILRLRCAGRDRAIDLSRPPQARMIYLGPGQPPAPVLHLPPETCAPPEAAALAALAGLGAASPLVALLVDGQGHLRQSWDHPPSTKELAEAVSFATAMPARPFGHQH